MLALIVQLTSVEFIDKVSCWSGSLETLDAEKDDAYNVYLIICFNIIEQRNS
jgi:hypothetical protein